MRGITVDDYVEARKYFVEVTKALLLSNAFLTHFFIIFRHLRVLSWRVFLTRKFQLSPSKIKEKCSKKRILSKG